MNRKSWTELEPMGASGLISDAKAYVLFGEHKPYVAGDEPRLETDTQRRKLMLDMALASAVLLIGLFVNVSVTMGRFQIGRGNLVAGAISGLVISIAAVFFLVISVRRYVRLVRLEDGTLAVGEVVKVRQHKTLSRLPTALLPESRLVVTFAFTDPETGDSREGDQFVMLNMRPETSLKHLKPGREVAVQVVSPTLYELL